MRCARVLWAFHRPSSLSNLARLIVSLLAPETKQYQLQDARCIRLRAGMTCLSQLRTLVLAGWHAMIHSVTLCRHRKVASCRRQLYSSARIGSK